MYIMSAIQNVNIRIEKESMCACVTELALSVQLGIFVDHEVGRRGELWAAASLLR